MNLKKLTAVLAGGVLAGCCLTSPTALADSVQKAINVVTGISVYVNNLPLQSKNVQGNPTAFYHNGTVYVDIQEISAALGQKAVWNQATQSYYIGDGEQAIIIQPTPTQLPKQQKAAYLLDVCPPYQTDKNYQKPEKLKVAGKEYLKTFVIGGSHFYRNYGGWALYNLDGQYSKLNFDIGHIDGKNMEDAILNIYLDDELVTAIDVKANSLPKHYEVELKNAKQMKMAWKSHEDCNGSCYAFMNATIR